MAFPVAICQTEARESERALLRCNCEKLRTATGFVYGGMLSSVLWSVIGVLAWRVIA